MIVWAKGAVDVARQYTESHMELVKSFAGFNSSHLSLVRGWGAGLVSRTPACSGLIR